MIDYLVDNFYTEIDKKNIPAGMEKGQVMF